MADQKVKDETLYGSKGDVEIMPGDWRNFKGEERKYNAAGVRNFNIKLSKEKADELAEKGWNVKCRPPREEDAEELCYLTVAVEFEKGRPPKVVQITSGGQTRLDDETIGELDYAQITDVNLIIHPYEWTANGNFGIKAYLKTMYVTIEEDELERLYGKYDDTENQEPTDIPWDA